MIRHSMEENRFATREEFLQGLHREKMGELTSMSGVPLYNHNGEVYTDTTDSHTLIFGNTGTKKTRNFCIPSVYSIGASGESMIITDPKGEIYKNTSGFLANQGYDIQVLNFRDTEYSIRWNPLEIPYNYYKNGAKDKAIEMITDFAIQLKAPVHSDKDVYWENQAVDMFVGLVLIVFECEKEASKVNLKSVQGLRMYLDVSGKGSEQEVFWDLYNTFPENSVIRYKLGTLYSLRNTEKTFSSIVSVFDGMMSMFLFNDRIMSMLSASDIDIRELGDRKTAVYIIIPDEKTTFHFLVSVFVKQCYECLISSAHKNSNGQIKIRMNFVLDEFSNFPKISDMPAMISAARSRNIRFILIVQSKQQLTSMYGGDAETIKSNCRNWIFLACREIGLLDEISSLCGSVYTSDKGEVPLLNITQLQSLKIGWTDSQALILRTGVRPYITNVKDFSVYPQSGYPFVRYKKKPMKDVETFSAVKYMYDFVDSKLKKGGR